MTAKGLTVKVFDAIGLYTNALSGRAEMASLTVCAGALVRACATVAKATTEIRVAAFMASAMRKHVRSSLSIPVSESRYGSTLTPPYIDI